MSPHRPVRRRQTGGIAALVASALLGVTAPAALAAPAPAAPSAVAPGFSVPSVDNDDQWSRVTARAMGGARGAQTAESRGMYHSDLQPTGRFVRAGDRVVFDVIGSGSPVSYMISAAGAYADLNGGAVSGTEGARTALAAGRTVVTADSDGLVYLINTSTTTDVPVTVTGGAPVPVYVRGETSPADLVAQLERWPDSRFVTFVGERMFADMQRREVDQVRTQVPSWDPDVMVAYWDRVVDLADEVHGLSFDAVGTARRSLPRIRVVNPDSGPGWASAGNGRLMFQVNTWAGQDLLRSRDGQDHWGLWHEVGHTYQAPQYNWAGMGEIQVNLYSAAIQDRLGMSTRYTPGSQARREARDLFALPVEDRPRPGLDSANHAPEIMFEQLRRSFGEGFHPRVHQEYRVLRATGVPNPSGTEAQMQLYIEVASRAADRDLSEFFRQWGMPADAATLAAVSALPALSWPIWEFQDPATMPVENLLPAYQVPTGTLDGGPDTVVVGQSTAEGITVRELGSTGDGGAVVQTGSGVSTDARGGSGTVWATVQDATGVTEVLSRSVAVRRGEGLNFRGIGWGGSDDLAVTLALAPDTSTLWARSQNRTVHSYFPDQTYFSLELRGADGVSVVERALQGQENGTAFAATFDGVPFQDGQFLIAHHREAWRLNLFVGSEQQPNLAVQDQAFVIRDGALVRVGPDEVPERSEPEVLESAVIDVSRVHDAVAAMVYRTEITATGSGPIAFTVVDGELPPGLRLEGVSDHSARLVGFTQERGTSVVTFGATGRDGVTDTAQVTITVS